MFIGFQRATVPCWGLAWILTKIGVVVVVINIIIIIIICEYNAPSGTEVHVNNRVSASDPKSQPLRLKFMKHMPFGAQHQLK